MSGNCTTGPARDRLAELVEADLTRRFGPAAERRAAIDRRIEQRLALVGREAIRRAMEEARR